MKCSMRSLATLAVLAALLSSGAALAVQPDEVLSDPKLEARARNLSQELRCMVCQNQSIDDSEAPLARDLRLLVRERLTKGDSDSQVIQFLVARYGEFVLLKPRFELQTLLLWAAMPVALLCGAIALFFSARRRKTVTAGPEATLSGDEQRRLAALVKPGEKG
jgi:cytochrome c-type biogenesis protein CcmH